MHLGLIERGQDAILKTIAKGGKSRHVRERRLRELGGLAHADDAGDVFRPTAPPALLRSTDDQRRHAQPAPREERADTLGAVEFMRGEAHGVDADVRDVDRQLADRLRAVTMERHARGLANRGDLLDRKDHARLVIHPHNGDEGGLRSDGRSKTVQIKEATRIHLDGDDLEPLFGELGAQLARRRMLDGRRDDAPPRRAGGEESADGRVDRFSPAAGE